MPRQRIVPYADPAFASGDILNLGRYGDHQTKEPDAEPDADMKSGCGSRSVFHQ